MGKMIDAQSIVVASTATRQEGKEAAIFKAVFKHSIVLAILVGLLVHALRLRLPADHPRGYVSAAVNFRRGFSPLKPSLRQSATNWSAHRYQDSPLAPARRLPYLTGGWTGWPLHRRNPYYGLRRPTMSAKAASHVSWLVTLFCVAAGLSLGAEGAKQTQPAKNLLSDPSFELGSDKWHLGLAGKTVARFSVDSSDAADGQKSGLVTIGGVESWAPSWHRLHRRSSRARSALTPCWRRA